MPESKVVPLSKQQPDWNDTDLATAVNEILKSGLFDSRYYSQKAAQTFATPEKAIRHYLVTGATTDFDPHPLFSTNFYLEHHPEVRASGQNALLHFIYSGGKAKFSPSEYFDSAYYLQTYQDVAAHGLNPLAHYLAHGAAEGRNPSSTFDTKFYRNNLPTEIQTSVNPLVHYVLTGRKENRKVNDRREFPRDVYLKMREIEPLLPPFETLAKLPEVKQPKPSRAGKAYLALQKLIRGGFSHLVIVSASAGQEAQSEVGNVTRRVLEETGRALIVFTGLGMGSGTATAGIEALVQRQPDKLQTVTLHTLVDGLLEEEELAVLLRLAVQAQPTVMHVIESEVGWKLIQRYHRQLKFKSKLFASLFTYTIDEDGIRAGFPLHLNACLELLDRVFVPSEKLLSQLEKDFALGAEGKKRISLMPSVKQLGGDHDS